MFSALLFNYWIGQTSSGLKCQNISRLSACVAVGRNCWCVHFNSQLPGESCRKTVLYINSAVNHITMDGWVPKGNSATPGLSGDGAFERFLTAAIAAIITIMFSWRLLDDMNDQDLQREGHRVGKVDVHTEVKHTEEIDHDSILIDSVVSSRSESTRQRMMIGNEIVSFESRQGMTSIINIDNDTDWERYQMECDQYSEHVELSVKKQGIESSNRGNFIAHSSVLTDKCLPFHGDHESQYQEANSDDDSYCCTLLEPILEEDSDDIFSASDEQESKRFYVEEEMSYILPQWNVKPQAIYSDINGESSKPDAAVEYQSDVSAHNASCDTVDAAHSQAALNIPIEGTAETKVDGGTSTMRIALNNSEFHEDHFVEHVQSYVNITETVLCASEPATNNIEILVAGNMENDTKQSVVPHISEDCHLQEVASQEMNNNWICPQQQCSPRFGNRSSISDNVHLSTRLSEKCEDISECNNDDQITVAKQSFVSRKTSDQAEECEKLIHDGIVFNQETGSLISSVGHHNINTKDCTLPQSLLEESTVTPPGTLNVLFSDLTSEDFVLKSGLPVCPVGLSNDSNKNNEKNSDSINVQKVPGRCNHIAFNRAHVYDDAGISTAQEVTPHGFIFLQCESEQSRSERRTFLVDKPLYPDFDTFINSVPFTSEGFEEVHDWSLENDGYSDFVRELSRSDSVKDSACSSALQGMCPILSGNLITPLGSNAFEFPKHLVSSEATENTVTAESEASEMKDEIPSDISSDRSLVMRSDTLLLSNSHLRERNAQYLNSSFTEDRLVNNDGRASQFAYIQDGDVLQFGPMKSETSTAEKIVDLSTKYEGSLLNSDVSLQDQEHSLFENHTILLAGPEVRCIVDSENKNLQVPEAEKIVVVDSAACKQSCFENKMSFDDSKDGAPHDDESRNSSDDDDDDNEISDQNISCSEMESSEKKHEEELHQHAYKHSYGEKRPRSLKEIRRKHAQQKSFMSVVQQNQPFRSFIGHFTIPDHLITPTKVKIMASRKKFLSAETLNESCSTDSVQKQFDLHKMPKPESRERLYKSPKRLYKSQFNSQDQIEKLQNLINFSRQSEMSLERTPIHHLHENCIFSPQGRRDLLNKTLSIENMQLPFPDESCKCVSLPSLLFTDVSGFDTSDGRLFCQTNHDVNDCLFQQQPLERSASMSNLQSGSMLTSNEGILTSSSKKVGKGRFAHHQHKKSKSLCTLETNIDDVDTENTGNLMRVPSVHELRVSKSLQKLNVPDWFKQSSLSKSSSCLLKYGSNSTMNSFSFSPSLVSSPCASTAPPASNIVIKSRVLPPSSACHLRSPRSLITGVSDSKLPAPSVKLPSEKFRDKEKSKSLMPIPIVPFAQIRAMFEGKSKKQQDIQHETAKQAVAGLPTVNVIDVGAENAESQNSLKKLSTASEKRLYKNDPVSNSLVSEKEGSDQKRTANLQSEGQGLQTEMRKTGADLQSSSPSTIQDNIINGKHTAQKPDLFQEAQFERHQEKDPKAHSSMKSFKQLLGLSKDNSFDNQQQKHQTGFKLHKSAVYDTEPRRLGVTHISLSSEARQEAQFITQTSNSDTKSKTLVMEASNISQSVASMSTKSAVTPTKETSHIGKNPKGISSANLSSIHNFPGSPPMQGSVQPEPLHGGKSSSHSTAAVAHLDPKTTATRSLKETTV